MRFIDKKDVVDLCCVRSGVILFYKSVSCIVCLFPLLFKGQIPFWFHDLNKDCMQVK